MSWAGDFPDALRVRPLGLVVLSGLDATYNAVHKAVWDLFCNNRKADRVPLNFITFPVDHEYPKAKPKRTSYEWYSPKGILRRDWMDKHLAKVPSLIITFFDLDWDDPHWNERLIECASRLNIIRNSIEKRSTKLAAVLIQQSPPLPPGEDNLAAERAAAFCTECELSPKSLFVLPQTDHLFGYIIRLENAFLELSHNYYTTNIRRVKAHRDYLNRSTHQVLFIRHQFKVAFFHEMKQDTHMALKHYKQAYGYCLEAKVSDYVLLEVKTIAGFISYKICALSFHHNAPLDAIEQFRKHIEHFKQRVGPASLAFEHSSWLSKQFQLFGEIFEEAVRKGLAALQTQHPGFYYQQAATNAITRKQLCIGLCHAGAPVPPVPDRLEFFGHRPWFPSQASNAPEVADQMSHENAIRSLQSLELSTNHSEEIINLLTIAVSHFQKYRCTRLRYHLLVMIGEEHYHAKEYSKALQILTLVAQEYRREKWYSLLTSVITTALRSAYLLASIEDYAKLSLEHLAEEVCRSAETKSRVQVDLLQVICGQVPDPQPGCDVQAVDAANQKWQSAVANKAEGTLTGIVVDMNTILSFVDCKVCFMKSKYKVDEDVKLSVYIRCKSQFSLRFSQLQLLFSDEKYNSKCVVSDDGDLMSVVDEDQLNSKDLLFLPNETKAFSFTLNPTVQDMGKSLQVTNVQLKLNSALPVTLNFGIDSGSFFDEENNDDMISSLSLEEGNIPAWTAIPYRNGVDLACRSSELILSTDCDTTCLLNEAFPMTWKLVNQESCDISNVRCSFLVSNSSVPSVLSMSQVDVIKSESGIDNFTLEKMTHGEQVERVVYLRSNEIGQVNVTAKVLYNIGSDQFYQNTELNLEIIEPFKVVSRFMSTKFEDRLTVNADEPFLLQFALSNVSKYPIYIKHAQLCLSSHVPEGDNQLVPQINDVVLDTDEEATEYQCLVIPDSTNNEIIPGEYKLTWRRKAGDEDSLVERIISLPALSVEHQPLYVKCEVPAYGHVHKPLEIMYTLYNRTGYVQEFEASMDSCEAFAFSGHKQLHFRTLPYASHSINYTMYPLTSGRVPLPPFRLNMMKHTNMTDAISKLIPQNIYIMPMEYNPTSILT